MRFNKVCFLAIVGLIFVARVPNASAEGLPRGDHAFFAALGQIQGLVATQASFLNSRSKSNLGKKEIERELLRRLSGSRVPAAFVHAALFNPKTRVIPKILQLFKCPAETMPYEEYRKLFITPDNIDTGARFVRDHQALLSQIQKDYDMDPLVLISLVGVETRWGRYPGTFPVMSALYTISSRLPSLSHWALGELAAYLTLCYKGSINTQSILGSYAGAFGYYQFMPSNYNAYAVDFDGDGIKSYDRWPDVLASVANYLDKHGYAPGNDEGPGSPVWNSLYAYNPSDNYVRAILELRESIRERLQSSAALAYAR